MNWLGAAGALALVFSASSAFAQGKPGTLIGYHHTTFQNGASNGLRVKDIPMSYDIINLSFCEPTTPLGSTIGLRAVESGVYKSEQDLIDDIKVVQGQGRKVYCSLGGADGVIGLNNQQDVNNFVTSLNGLIDKFNLDGIDIDLEGGSLSIAPGDTDFRNPRSPKIVNTIAGIRGVLSAQGSDFGLSMAPETFLVQVGMEVYAGAAGASLAVIDAFRNELDSLQVQYYNTGSVTGLDGVAYPPATVDHLTSLVDMLLVGFPVAGSGATFQPLPANKVAIGLPSSPAAAGRGQVSSAVVGQALNALVNGANVGRYQVRSRNNQNFLGVMLFSINHGIQTGGNFVPEVRTILNSTFRGAAGDAPRVSQGIAAILR